MPRWKKALKFWPVLLKQTLFRWMNGKGHLGLRLAHSLMALNVSLKFSLFGTKYNISSVTRQPGKRKQQNPLNLRANSPLEVMWAFRISTLQSGNVTECTIETADASNIQIFQDGVSPEVQVVWDGWQGQSGEQQVNLKQERIQTDVTINATSVTENSFHKYWCLIICRLFSKQEVCSCFQF